VGGVIARYFRAVNGLEERPHAGHPFYLLVGPGLFAGQSEVVLLVATALVPLLLAVLPRRRRRRRGAGGEQPSGKYDV